MSQPADQVTVAVVPDISRFPAQLRAGVDRSMRDIAQTIDRQLRQVGDNAAAAGRDIASDFSSGAAGAGAALRQLGDTAERQFDRIDREATQAAAGMSTKLRSAALVAAAAIAGIGVAAAAGLGLVAGFGLKTAASLEQTTIGFEALLGSATQAKDFLAELQTFAASTPFEFQGVADASRRILAFGQSVGITRDEIIPTIKTIGDLAAVLGVGQQEIDSVVRAMGQMASKGKVSQEEILQLAEALPGFNANAAIASSLGLSVADTLELITKGGVDAKTGIDALLQGMANFGGAAGAMEKQAGTLLGVFSTFKDTISIELANAFAPVIPEIKTTLSEITPVIGDAVGEIAPALGGLISSTMPLLASMLQAITPILTVVLDMMGDIATAPGMGEVWVELGEALGEAVAALRPLIPVLAKVFVAVLQGLTPAIAGLAPVFDELVPVVVELVEALLPSLPAIGELISSVVLLLVPLSELIRLLLLDTHLVDVLAGAIELLSFFIGGAADAIGEFAKWLQTIDWGAVGSAIGGFFSDIWADITGFFSDTTKRLKELPQQALTAFNGLRDAAIARISAMVALVRALPGRIVAAIGNLGRTLFTAGQDMIAGLWEGIKQAGGWLASRIKTFINEKVVGTVKNVLGISSPSTVMANEVGRQIPPGIGMGIAASMPDLESLLGNLTGGLVTNTSHVATTIHLGGVHFGGRPSTPQEAAAIGSSVAAGAVAEMERRRVVNAAVRMA